MRFYRWAVLLVCWGVYALAFSYPATAPRNPAAPVWGSLEPHLAEYAQAAVEQSFASGHLYAMSGTEAFYQAWISHERCWWGNLGLWLGTILVLLRLWCPAALVAGIGWYYASFPIRDEFRWPPPKYVCAAGYWLWFSGLGLFFLGTLAGWWGVVGRADRAGIRQVFRGWRGAAIGSWLALGVWVVYAWWTAKWFHPPDACRNTVVGLWLLVGLGIGFVDRVGGAEPPKGVWAGFALGSWVVFAITAAAVAAYWEAVNPLPLPP